MYRLTLTCSADTREGEIRLAWAPGGPEQGQELSVAVDGKTTLAYKVEGHETMGNTGAGGSGPGDIVLKAAPLPAQTLKFGNLVGGKTVVFSFGGLKATKREGAVGVLHKKP